MTASIFRAGTGTEKLHPGSNEISWHAYADGVRFLALRSLGDSAEADDIAQESIARAIAATRDPDREPIEDPAGFLYGIARHLVVDALRRRERLFPIQSAEAFPAEHPDALKAIVTAENHQRLRSLLKQLDPADRNLIELSFVHGLKSPEIAIRTGETPEAVRKRKSRLIERLRAALPSD